MCGSVWDVIDDFAEEIDGIGEETGGAFTVLLGKSGGGFEVKVLFQDGQDGVGCRAGTVAYLMVLHGDSPFND